MTEESYGPGACPPGLPLAEEKLLELVAGHLFGTLATLKRDGHPHLTTVVYSWDAVELVAGGAIQIPEGQPLPLEQFERAGRLAEAPAHGGKPSLMLDDGAAGN
jgi:hypothetical protein